MCVFSCISLHLGEAFCIMSCHDLFLFVVVVDFSLVTALFCFISFDILLTTFCVYIECLCVCFLASLCDFCKAFCIMSHRDLFLC